MFLPEDQFARQPLHPIRVFGMPAAEEEKLVSSVEIPEFVFERLPLLLEDLRPRIGVLEREGHHSNRPPCLPVSQVEVGVFEVSRMKGAIEKTEFVDRGPTDETETAADEIDAGPRHAER